MGEHPNQRTKDLFGFCDRRMVERNSADMVVIYAIEVSWRNRTGIYCNNEITEFGAELKQRNDPL